ncbi:MAG: deoxynucleoside kinase [Labilithrix sp.]|nr:deoxynucleoside kinase [Labilithrix sp.]
MKRYVAVAGTIGAGKTSLVSWLVKRYGLEPFYEPNDENPYLADFYRDMKAWAFHSQVFFLSHKLKLHQELLAANLAKRSCVIDRTIYEDAEIFARNARSQRYISARDWAVYERLYEGIKKTLRPPDVLIAVSCSLTATKKRISRRGRAMENAIPDAYLRRLHRLYEDWFARYDLGPIVKIDTTKLDYVEDLVDLIALQSTLDRALR